MLGKALLLRTAVLQVCPAVRALTSSCCRVEVHLNCTCALVNPSNATPPHACARLRWRQVVITPCVNHCTAPCCAHCTDELIVLRCLGAGWSGSTTPRTPRTAQCRTELCSRLCAVIGRRDDRDDDELRRRQQERSYSISSRASADCTQQRRYAIRRRQFQYVVRLVRGRTQYGRMSVCTRAVARSSRARAAAAAARARPGSEFS
eukprot:SAG31_NODE_176_length_21334_cov_12.211067_20_plen_205_part_00